MLLEKYKRRPDAWNKHVVPYLESEATSFPANTAHPFKLIPWLLELDSGSASSSPEFLMMYSAYKLKKQGDNI